VFKLAVDLKQSGVNSVESVLTDLTQGAFKLAMQLLQQPADAHDVLQDAAAIAISHPGAPRARSNEFKPWFYKVVRNKAIDRLRELKRKNHESLDEQSVTTLERHGPEAVLQQSQLQQQVQLALTKLSREQREIILLKDFHGFAYGDIAQILDIPKGTVMSRLHRARMALREQLVPYMTREHHE
jgi:RNA polymerase sigma-70 factor (ECF subfamily)